MKIVLETSREGYTPSQCGSSITVEDLVCILREYDADTEVYFSNDDGYTYGSISWSDIKEYDEDEE